MVYAIHIQQQYIYMEYTRYIPTIYLVGVPEVVQTCMYIMMIILLCTSFESSKHVCTMYNPVY